MTAQSGGKLEPRTPTMPKHPRISQIVFLLAETYKPVGIRIVLAGRNRALGGERVQDLLKTSEGRQRVYAYALGLAEGVMG